MKTHRVSYRLVPDTQPHVAVVLTYTIDATSAIKAEVAVYNIMIEDISHMFGFYDGDWLRRTTIVRVR